MFSPLFYLRALGAALALALLQQLLADLPLDKI